MQLEEFFELERFETEFGPVERIRIKGHRISIEHVIEASKKGMTPEEIVRDYYPSLSLEEVRAALAYYQSHQSEIDDYIARGEQVADAYYQEYLQQPPSPVLQRLRELKAQRQGGNASGG